MGRSGLSSKRKFSKKKSLKISSEARQKKSRRNKSKKLRRHDDSFSSYSDDDSTSSLLVSSSSSEGEYKSGRARSRARNEVKGSRKRTRRRSLREESSKDSPPVKKRKRTKKKDDSKTKKKKKNKKSRRDAYISPKSSDSGSCSTCKDGDSSSDDGASLGRPRGRSREKKKDHRDSIKGRMGHRKNRSRPRSSSPSKLSNSYDDDSIEKVVVENNPRRLKSVITVAIQPEEEEGNEMKKDELKEEIVYDYDDYPSCKSNDSNDGENKKELVSLSNVSSEKRTVASVIGEVNSASSLKDNKSVSPGRSAGKERVDCKEKESNASVNIESEAGNLESILRQKALENLSRFRGGLQTKAVVPVDYKNESDQRGVKQSPTAKVNRVETQSKLPAPEQDGFGMMGMSQPVIQRSRFTWRRDPSVASGKGEKAATYSGTDSGRSQAPAPKLQSANLSSTSRIVNKTAYETSKIVANTNNSSGGIETNDGQKSTTALETPSCASTEEGSSKEHQTETKDNSQFEQKTMSVMRGGEMVQVSYKVYIPKKAPALARRQLKR